MEKNIIENMDEKIAAITDTALQKAHNDITANSTAIKNVQADLSPLKEIVADNSLHLKCSMETQEDMKQRISNCEKIDALNVLRMQSIEDELGQKAYQMPQNEKRRLRDVEHSIAALRTEFRRAL